MSGPTIRFSEATVIPEVSIAADVGNTLEIKNIDDFDLDLLGNKQKIGVSTPPRTQSPGIKDVSSNNHNDGIEFVNLEDTNSTFQVKPPAGGDTIRIVRDAPAPVKVVEEAPFALKSGPSTSAFQPIRPQTPAPAAATAVPEATTASATAAAADPPKSWFSNITGSSTNKTSSSWFGGSGSAAPAQAAALPEKTEYLTPEQEAIKKTESLTMLERMDRRGIGGNKMSMMNSYEEIQAELSKRKDSKALEASLRFQRSMLTTVTNGMEFLNNRYDPLGVNLDGWSEQINENLEDYDEIFEELYDKYKDRSKVAPEVRLIMSLGLSAAMCHVTNTMFKSRMPGMDDILRKNPDLAKQMAQAAAEQAVGPGFANFVSLGMGSRGQPQQQQQQQAPAAFNSASEERYTSVRAPTPPPVPTARREMRGPTGVDDIIEKLNNAGENHSQRSVPNIDAEEIASVGSGMTTNTMRRQGLSSRRRTTAQPTGSVLTLNV